MTEEKGKAVIDYNIEETMGIPYLCNANKLLIAVIVITF